MVVDDVQSTTIVYGAGYVTPKQFIFGSVDN